MPKRKRQNQAYQQNYDHYYDDEYNCHNTCRCDWCNQSRNVQYCDCNDCLHNNGWQGYCPWTEIARLKRENDETRKSRNRLELSASNAITNLRVAQKDFEKEKIRLEDRIEELQNKMSKLGFSPGPFEWRE